jgi:hypothetical protein
VTAAAARPSDLRAFVAAPAFPLAIAVMLAVSLVAFGGPAVMLQRYNRLRLQRIRRRLPSTVS